MSKRKTHEVEDRKIKEKQKGGMQEKLKWPVAWDENGQLVTPLSAKNGHSYFFLCKPIIKATGKNENVINNEMESVPLVYRRSTENRVGHFALSSSSSSSAPMLAGLGHCSLSGWHMLYQCFARPEFREIRIADNRADIRTPAGRTIEIQRSRISIEQVRERNRNHKHITWLLDNQRDTNIHPQKIIPNPSFQALCTFSLFNAHAPLLTLPKITTSSPIDSSSTKDTKLKNGDFFEQFRFTTKETKETKELSKLKESTMEEPIPRVFMDVGFDDHLLRVDRCSLMDGCLLCEVSLVSLDDFLHNEYGVDALVDESQISTLVHQRQELLRIEKSALKARSVKKEEGELGEEGTEKIGVGSADDFMRRVWMVEADVQRKLCELNVATIRILESRVAQLKQATKESIALQKVARICDQCQLPFPFSRHHGLHQKLCPSCTHRSLPSMVPLAEAPCSQCGIFFPIPPLPPPSSEHSQLLQTSGDEKSLLQEPESGKFYCAKCARPCITLNCRNFAFNRSKKCFACFQ
jgi:hypothetical protein